MSAILEPVRGTGSVGVSSSAPSGEAPQTRLRPAQADGAVARQRLDAERLVRVPGPRGPMLPAPARLVRAPIAAQATEQDPAVVHAELIGLRRGSTSTEAVAKLQRALNVYAGREALVPDGSFGRKTDDAVRAFQEAKGLTVDGIVGRNTVRALGPYLSPPPPPPPQTTGARMAQAMDQLRDLVPAAGEVALDATTIADTFGIDDAAVRQEIADKLSAAVVRSDGTFTVELNQEVRVSTEGDDPQTIILRPRIEGSVSDGAVRFARGVEVDAFFDVNINSLTKHNDPTQGPGVLITVASGLVTRFYPLVEAQ